ncbi:MAG TPA: hypothetical protein VF971_01315 [Candidatus Limnocylindrales bacterium]
MTADAASPDATRTLADPLAESLRVVDLADQRGLQVRLIGGMAIRAHAPDWTARTRRLEVDLDFATRARDRAAFFTLLEEEGYTPDRRHNALFGGTQGYFVDVARNRPVDVLVDKLEMCHRLDFGDRLGVSKPTLPLAELVLSKLQVVKINRKDVLDALVLLAEHPLGPDDGAPDARHGLGTVSLPRVTSYTSGDWGWWRTVTGNLDVLAKFLDGGGYVPEDLDIGTQRPVRFDPLAQVTGLRAAIDAAPKSTRWNLRARVGERVRWYAEPEEVGHA